MYMGDRQKAQTPSSTLHASMLQQAVGRLLRILNKMSINYFVIQLELFKTDKIF